MPDQSHRGADPAAGALATEALGSALEDMAVELATEGQGLVSVYCAPEVDASNPFVSSRPDAQHYAASTMKVAVLLAAHRAFDDGIWSPRASLLVHDTFPSAAGGTFSCTRDYDSDAEVWNQLGKEASSAWLLARMIVRSSNLATNLVIEHLGFDAVNESWRIAGSHGCAVQRLIQDSAADWLTNQVTAPGLSLLMRAVTSGEAATPESTKAMTEILRANELTDDVVAGLPAGTWVAHKNGWIEGIHHTTALIRPDDAPGFFLTVCSSTGLPKADGQRLLSRIARASWQDRFQIARAVT